MAEKQPPSPGSTNTKSTKEVVGDRTAEYAHPVIQRRPTQGVDPAATAKLRHALTEKLADWGLPDPRQDGFVLEEFLRRMLANAAEHDLYPRHLGVSFDNIKVTGSGQAIAHGKTFTDVLRGPLTLWSAFNTMRHKQKKTIIEGFTGRLNPGDMCLVLGRPGAGCTTFLKTLANDRASFDKVEGSLDYDGFSPADLARDFAGDVVYLPEDDFHFPTLTVEQTLQFVAKCKAPAKGARLPGRTRADFIAMITEVCMTLYGLRHTRNTKVGNDTIRGVSGGERKRVSIAEASITRPKIGCFDNSTKGLDSATSLDYVKSLRTFTDLLGAVTVTSMYQASEGMYEHFDKVCVIMEGRMIYFGPASAAKAYFENLGFIGPERQTTPDFLVAVTDQTARKIRPGYESRTPRTAAELAQAFLASQIHAQECDVLQSARSANSAENAEAYRRSVKLEKAKHARFSYNASYYMQVGVALRRRIQLVKGDITAIIQFIVNIVQALIIGSVFYQIPNSSEGFFSRGGVIFFAILFNSLSGMAEIAAMFFQRPIIARQQRYALLRPSADALASTLVEMPIKFITITAFDLVLYWMAGLAPSAGQFFTFLLFTFVGATCMSNYFRMIAALANQQSVATIFAGVSVLILIITVGYSIPSPSLLGWERWINIGLNPLAFLFEALVSNEFLHIDDPCSQYIPSGGPYSSVSRANQACPAPGYDPATGLVNGPAYLFYSLGYSYSHTWRNLGIVMAFWIFFLIVQLVATERLKHVNVSAFTVLFARGKGPRLFSDSSDSQDDLEALSTTKSGAPYTEQAQATAVTATSSSDSGIFAWRHLNYDVQIKKESRRLLNNVSGYVPAGKLTALMGTSGAGKTTLLNALAQRATSGIIEGELTLNGRPLPHGFQRMVGYAQQEDVHMPTATVREALQFSAKLRQPQSVPCEEKLAYVEEVIRLLEMEDYADALTGRPGEGLNVEQFKKLTIGVELAAKPKLLLFLDEPTSGLDSQSAWAIIRLLRKLADAGQAIVATIHQPSAELFNEFDRLLLLRKGGETVYFGDTGPQSRTLIDYFERTGGHKCQEEANPAEWMLTELGTNSSIDWPGEWRKSAEAKRTEEELDQYTVPMENKSSAIDSTFDQTYATSFLTQVKLVGQRAFQSYWRDTTYLISKIMLNMMAALFIGFSFFKASYSVTGLSLRMFAIFMSFALSSALANQLQPRFLAFRDLYEVREAPARTYRWVVFVISSILVEIPWNILGSTIYFLIWCWTVNIAPGTSRQGYLYAVYLLYTLWFSTFAQALAALAPNAQIAALLFAFGYSFTMIFCGVVQPTRLMPTFWRAWMPHVVPFRYLIEAMLSTSVGGGIDVYCTEKTFATVTPPAGQTCSAYLNTFASFAGGYVQNPEATSNCLFCPYRTGDQWLATLGLNYDNRAKDIGYICVYIVFNLLLCFATTYFFRVKGKASTLVRSPRRPPATVDHRDKDASITR